MSSEHYWPSEFGTARALLAKAALLAKSLDRPEWDFAVEIEELLSLGLSRADLRWLVCQGFLDHAAELAAELRGSRRFQRTGELFFGRRTCFILTALGQAAELEPTSRKGESSHLAPHRDSAQFSKPYWDSDLKRLSLGDLVVKEFRSPAPNQQLVLSAFQEDDWPPRIDDPLPPTLNLNPKRRLIETISSLNRGQRNHALRFSGDGSGMGVIWTPVS